MFTAAQSQYLQEVLGVSPSDFFVSNVISQNAAETSDHTEYETVVMTGELSHEELTLLNKILSSVTLGEFTRLEVLRDIRAKKVLVFGHELSIGRHEFEDSTWWSAPALQTMIGSGPVVAENKKTTWNMLQQMAKELR